MSTKLADDQVLRSVGIYMDEDEGGNLRKGWYLAHQDQLEDLCVFMYNKGREDANQRMVSIVAEAHTVTEALANICAKSLPPLPEEQG